MTSLFDRITALRNLRVAYRVLDKRYYNSTLHCYSYKPGPDGDGFEEFNRDLKGNLEKIQLQMKSQDFAFGPYSLRSIPKHTKRWLVGQFNLRDRIIYRAIFQIVAPRYDHIFSDALLSYRRKMGPWDALLKAMRIVRGENGKVWVFRTDVHHYVERMDHEILREKLVLLFGEEPEVLRLMLAFLVQPRISEGVARPREFGTHPGSELTTFFYNLYLSDLDHYMVEKGFRYFRYSDDIVVFAGSEEEVKRTGRIVARFVKKMKLELNPSKTLIRAPGEAYEYLGYTFSGLTFAISKHSLLRLKRWVRRQLKMNSYAMLKEHSLSKEEAIRIIIGEFQSVERTQKLISWLGYFQLISDPSQLKSIDRMIRERIGACLTQRIGKKNYKHASPKVLRDYGLHSLVGLYYRMHSGRPLPKDIRMKLREQRLFSPRI